MDFDSVYTVIEYIGDHYKSTKEKGDMWERAVVYYLRHDPEMRQVMSDMRLWEDAETNDGHDTGIDIVAADGIASSLTGSRRYWAVQCKNFDASHKMDYKELSTFWAKAVADERYSGYAIGYTVKMGTPLITPEKMGESNVNLNGFATDGGRSVRAAHGRSPNGKSYTLQQR